MLVICLFINLRLKSLSITPHELRPPIITSLNSLKSSCQRPRKYVRLWSEVVRPIPDKQPEVHGGLALGLGSIPYNGSSHLDQLLFFPSHSHCLFLHLHCGSPHLSSPWSSWFHPPPDRELLSPHDPIIDGLPHFSPDPLLVHLSHSHICTFLACLGCPFSRVDTRHGLYHSSLWDQHQCNTSTTAFSHGSQWARLPAGGACRFRSWRFRS